MLCPTGEHLHRQIAFCATLSLIGTGINYFKLQIKKKFKAQGTNTGVN